MNVLIATPTYADRLRPETVAAVQAQEFAGPWEWRVYRHNPHPEPCMANVLAQYQHIHSEFLAGSWDALLTVEHDMIPPAHALQALWDANKPVVYGVYMLRHGAAVLNAWEYTGGRSLGESLSIQHRRSRPQRLEGLVRVSGVGFGCTLIRREVLVRLPMHGAGVGDRSPDVPFAEDCNRYGIEQYAHFGVLCGHIHEGRALWPMKGDRMADIEVAALQTVTVNVQGRSERLEAGRAYTLPSDLASDLQRAGYVRLPDVSGNPDAHDGQPPDDAGTQPGKPARTKRPRLRANAAA